MIPAPLAKIARSPFFTPFLILAGFFLFYWCAAQEMKSSPVYVRDDVVFRADTSRALKDMTGDRDKGHAHTSGHPNFVVLHCLLGNFLRDTIKSNSVGMKKLDAVKHASIILTSLAAAATAALFYCLLLTHGVTRLRALLFTGVLGCSSVQMFYASTPETYIFTALGLTALALVASRRDAGGFWWQAAAVYSWAILTTNIVQVGIWSLARYWQRPFLPMVLRLVKVTAITIAATVALSYLQLAVYPKSLLFFTKEAFSHESGWIYWERLQQPFHFARILLQHMFLSNIVAPEPVVTTVFDMQMASIEAGSWEMIRPSLPLLGLWGVVLAVAAAGFRHLWPFKPAVLAALGTLLFEFCFFFLFGHDRMLYAAIWTSTIVFLVALSADAWLKRHPKFTTAATALLAVVICGEAWHNWAFLGKIARLVTE